MDIPNVLQELGYSLRILGPSEFSIAPPPLQDIDRLIKLGCYPTDPKNFPLGGPGRGELATRKCWYLTEPDKGEEFLIYQETSGSWFFIDLF